VCCGFGHWLSFRGLGHWLPHCGFGCVALNFIGLHVVGILFGGDLVVGSSGVRDGRIVCGRVCGGRAHRWRVRSGRGLGESGSHWPVVGIWASLCVSLHVMALELSLVCIWWAQSQIVYCLLVRGSAA
jgi:hypothetical protein